MGSMPIHILHHYPTASVVGVDLDCEGLKLAGSLASSLADSTRLQLLCADANEFVAKSPSHSFDAVFVDVFDNGKPCDFVFEPSFLQSISRITKPGGGVSINVFRAQSGKLERVGQSVLPNRRVFTSSSTMNVVYSAQV